MDTDRPKLQFYGYAAEAIYKQEGDFFNGSTDSI